MKLILLFTLFFSAPLYANCPDCPVGEQSSLPQGTLPEWPLELVPIKQEVYRRNQNVDFCKRPAEMLDTIVLHHSETPPNRTAQDMNKYHLERGWYMGGYSFVVNSPYPGATTPAATVTEGRPLELVGSHAGSDAFVPMTEAQQELWDSGKIVCGKERGEFKVDPNQIRGNKIKANVTTLGVVIIGNYVPYSRQNPNGYPRNRPRNPSAQTQDLVAKLSCQLQKKYPGLKSIKWHNYYQSTDCPGTVKLFINDIKTIAKRYGCDFQ